MRHLSNHDMWPKIGANRKTMMNWQWELFVTYDFRYQSVIQRVWDNSDMIRFLKRRVTGGYLPCRGSVIVLLALFVIVGSFFFIHSSWIKGRGVVRPPTHNRKDEIQDVCSNPICVPRKECRKQEVRKCQTTYVYKYFYF